MSDLGKGDIVIALPIVERYPKCGLTAGSRYTVEEVVPTPMDLKCVLCDNGDRAVVLVGVFWISRAGRGRIPHCPCTLRKIGGPDVLERFKKELLKPVDVPWENDETRVIVGEPVTVPA